MKLTRSRYILRTDLLTIVISLLLLSAVFETGYVKAANDLEIHGFVSQSYFITDKNDFLMKTKSGTFENNEAVINFMYQANNKLRVGMQFTGRDFGKDGNGFGLIDWAYADYRLKDYFGIKMGKIKNPFGMGLQYVDVDMARTSILQPQAIYNERMRDLILATEGFSAYGKVEAGPVGQLEYDAVIGVLNFSNPQSPFWDDIFINSGKAIMNGLAAQLFRSDVQGIFDSYDSPKISSKLCQGNRLIWHTPIDGLKLSGTFAKIAVNATAGMNGEVVIPTTTGPYVNLVHVPYDLHVDVEMKVYGFEYAKNRFKVAGELSDMIYFLDNKVNGVSMRASERPYGYYGLTSYNWNDYLTTELMYSESFANWNDKDGDVYAGTDTKYRAWLKDIGLSVRYDVNPNWILKVEGHRMDGANTTLVKAAEDELNPARYWYFGGLRSTVSF